MFKCEAIHLAKYTLLRRNSDVMITDNTVRSIGALSSLDMCYLRARRSSPTTQMDTSWTKQLGRWRHNRSVALGNNAEKIKTASRTIDTRWMPIPK